MTLKPAEHAPAFADPALEIKAQQGLNRLVMTLMQRVAQSRNTAPDRIGTLHVIEDPALIDEVLKSPAVFQKNFALVAALGESRFNLNGERWAQFRDRTQPAFNKASKPDEVPQIEDIYRTALDQTLASDGIAFETALVQGSLNVFCKALKIDLDADAITRLFPEIRTHAKVLQFFSWYGAQEPDVLLERAQWLEDRFIAVVQADPSTTAFIRTVTGDQAEEWSPAVTDLMQNLFAGVETTVATLSWAVHLLGQNATLQAALRVEANLPARSRPLTRGFLWETMRCFPPIPFVVRQLSDDYTGHGRHFRKGEQVILSILGLHRHADHWGNPNEFHAGRAEFSDGKFVPMAFRPFLSGPRVCGGKRLAEMELLVALPLILRRWQITSIAPDIDYDYALALRPRDMGAVRLDVLRG